MKPHNPWAHKEQESIIPAEAGIRKPLTQSEKFLCN